MHRWDRLEVEPRSYERYESDEGSLVFYEQLLHPLEIDHIERE